MTEREKLIELLNEWGNKENDGVRAESIADYLFRNGVTVLPCKVDIGQIVYQIITTGNRTKFKRVSKNSWQEKEQTIKHFIRQGEITKNNFYDIVFGDTLGKTVFLTKQEAEKALERSKQ